MNVTALVGTATKLGSSSEKEGPLYYSNLIIMAFGKDGGGS